MVYDSPSLGYSVTVIENEQRQLLYRESRGKGECGRKLPLKNTSKKKCVPKWNCSHVVSMYFPLDCWWWDVNHLWNQTDPVQAPVPTGASCFRLARSLVSWRTTSTSWGCVRDRKLAISHLAFISTLSSSYTSNRDAQDKRGKMEGKSDTGLTAHDPSKSGYGQSLFSPELQCLF